MTARLRTTRTLVATFCAGLCLSAAGDAGTRPQTGDTRIARWKDDRKAAFLLMFDDSWPSHWQVAAPELAKRGLTATFYINPGKGEHSKFADKWEQEVWRLGMAYGCHTMTHRGAVSVEEADREIGDCTREILRIVPGRTPRLVSWGMPGVKTWNVTPEQLHELLVKHHLVNRPDFKDHGAVYHLKTTAEMLALADRAIRDGDVEHLVIHGVERITPDWSYQDFWPLKQDVFLPLLDALKERSDRGDLWVTDHISQHKYATGRDAASVTSAATSGSIRVELSCTADPRFYDLPLTLVTRVPASWSRCRISQGTNTALATAEGGDVRYEAIPGRTPILLLPAGTAEAP